MKNTITHLIDKISFQVEGDVDKYTFFINEIRRLDGDAGILPAVVI